MNNTKNCLVYIVPTGKYAKSTANIDIENESIILPLIEGMPTHHCLIKNIYIGMSVILIKRTFSWSDTIYKVGKVNIIGKYDKSSWCENKEIIAIENNQLLDIKWNESYGSRGRNVLDINHSKVNHYVNISNLVDCKKLDISTIRDNYDHNGWWTTLKRWNYQSHIPHLQWGIIDTALLDSIIINKKKETKINIENQQIIELNNNKNIEKKEKRIFLKVKKINIPKKLIKQSKIVLKSNEINKYFSNDFNRDWDLSIIKLISVMEVWTLMNKNNMTGDSLMWGWRYFIGNAIGNFINKNILSDSIELNQVMDDCINDIEESLKVSKSKFKFDKILLSKMNTNTKLIKNYVEELKKNIKDTWQDQYQSDILYATEIFDYMEEDEKRWKIYIKNKKNKTYTRDNLRYLMNQSYSDWIDNNKNKLLNQLNSSTNFNKFFNKNLLFANKSPLVRHIAYINYENPFKFENNKEKIVPFYIPLV